MKPLHKNARTKLVILAALLTYGTDRGAQLVYQYGSAVNWPAVQQQK